MISRTSPPQIIFAMTYLSECEIHSRFQATSKPKLFARTRTTTTTASLLHFNFFPTSNNICNNFDQANLPFQSRIMGSLSDLPVETQDQIFAQVKDPGKLFLFLLHRRTHQRAKATLYTDTQLVLWDVKNWGDRFDGKVLRKADSDA